MTQQTKTWWGQRFISALEQFTESGRLARGRAYSSDTRIKQWNCQDGKINARIRGNVNPYFGVYKEPTYQTRLQMKTLPKAQWNKVLHAINGRADLIARLMMGEMPENIESVFRETGSALLPKNYLDFQVSCSCPDDEVPCKHIAGVCYRLARLLDDEPFLLFELRGLAPEKLRQELGKSPLGKILLQSRETSDQQPEAVGSYYTRPETVTAPKQIDPSAFWHGERPLQREIDPPSAAAVPAILVKKGGDYPPFWNKQSSFIDIMEEFYLRMRKNSTKTW